MTKTIYPLLAQYSSTKWGKGSGVLILGGGGGAHFKFWPIGGALIRMGRLFKRGALIREGALIRGFTV